MLLGWRRRKQKKAKDKKKGSAVKALCDEYRPEKTHLFQSWKLPECAAYLQYKKKSGDPGIPSDLSGRQQRCIEWMGRPSLPSTPCQSDDEDDLLEMELDADGVGGVADSCSHIPSSSGGRGW